MTDTTAIAFHSEGERCDGALCRPDGVDSAPVIIMGHGFCAEYRFGLPAFAERFTQNGYAVLMFDYRGFGRSEGEPRRLVRVEKQLQDWRAAINHARSLDSVDGERVVLWGTSFSGGHVLTLAAEAGIAASAMIAQVPYVDSRASDQSFSVLLVRMLARAGADALKGRLGMKPLEVPIVGPADSLAVLNTAECEPGYRALIPNGTEFINRTPARVLLDMGNYRPRLTADRITCPALVVGGRDDSLIPVHAVRDAAERIPQGEFVELGCNHFQPYSGEWFERNIDAQLAFLKKTVPVNRRTDVEPEM